MSKETLDSGIQNGILWRMYMFYVWMSLPCAIALGTLYALGHFGIGTAIAENTAVRFILVAMSTGALTAIIAIEDRAVRRGRLDLNFWERVIDELKYSGSNALAKARAGLS